MKKKYILTAVQFIFYAFNIEGCLSDNKSNSFQDLYKESKKRYQEIDPATVSNKDSKAYTALVHLMVHTHNYYFAIQQDYSNAYRRTTKQSYDEAISNALRINSTENPMILETIQYVLLYAKMLFE